MEREKIIEKIKKLREHSVENGWNEAEAIQFALKAQELIADNDVEEWELADEVKRVTETTTGWTAKAWAPCLAQTIADNFRCKVYQRRVTARKDEFVFVGYQADRRRRLFTRTCSNPATGWQTSIRTLRTPTPTPTRTSLSASSPGCAPSLRSSASS